MEQTHTATSSLKLDNLGIVALVTLLNTSLDQTRKGIEAALQQIALFEGMNSLAALGNAQIFHMGAGDSQPQKLDEEATRRIAETKAEILKAKADFESGRGIEGILREVLEELRPKYELLKSSQDYFGELVERLNIREEKLL